MKKRALCAVLCLALCIVLGGQAFAAESGVSILVNETALAPTADVLIEERTTYVSYLPVVLMLYPEATAVWENGHALVTAEGLSMKIWLNTCYMEVNGRYLYLEDGVRIVDGNILVPIRVLGQALGATVEWDAASSRILVVGSGTAIQSGDAFYPSEDLYWLSHIIYAESGNQPMEGKIAVGNVVLNRVNDPRFPNTVYGVVFQRNQFTPAMTGTINRTPNESSVIAAKLCLEGANTAGESLYFVNPTSAPRSWASRNRPYVATIGAHAFFA
ncbi:cell wall hydrolase [Lawsonibacter celer]|jgi:N-acetylmuramoyl-L-alanine amidase|uniref:cell wall hydrolase n=1 Tax=Lawsonibacter celer TaxID=2986526 RepID=UPI0016469459|nr:cell wall hydrolase [Lawsonibacter celer]